MSAIRTARDAAVKIVSTLQDAGHVAYLAGGCVRDRIMGVEPKDYDVATDATPDRVRELFRNTQYVGEAFGVVIVRLAKRQIEVATFRIESGYDDGRRPTEVQFTDAEHDARRRDFTINGLFEDPITGEIIDFVNGRADIDARRIRAIGDADERFAEDYLRLLRAVRFAARLDFQIEARTARAIRNHARYLGQISRERIGQEVAMMFTAATVAQRVAAATMMQALHLDGPTLNEDHLDAPLTTMTALHADADYPTTLACWMADRHFRDRSADEVRSLCEARARWVVLRCRDSLALSNDTRDAMRATLNLAGQGLDWLQMGKADRKRWLAAKRSDQALHLLRAMAGIHEVRRIVAAIDAAAPALFAEGVKPQPWVTGDDLIRMGRKPGPVFGKLLDQAYDAQLDGTVANREEALRWVDQQS